MFSHLVAKSGKKSTRHSKIEKHTQTNVFGTFLPDNNKDSKMTIAVVDSNILTVFCALVMLILYHKYKTTNNNMKENKVYDLENFYYVTTTTNNYANQYSSNNPMGSVSSSYNDNMINNEISESY